MATHSVKKRKRTDTPMSAAGRGDCGKSDRRVPLPSPPRGATATAVASARENRSPSEPRPRKARAQRGQSRERQPHRVLRRTAAGGGLLGDQRCCVACGVGDDGGDRTALWKAGGERVRCAACDGEYHPGCVDRPGPYAPKRTKAKGEGQEAEDEDEDEEEGWVCGVCEEVALVRKPSGGDVAGPRESQSCSRPSSFGAGAGSQPAVAKAAPRRQQQRQQQQVGAAASHARFMDVMSSALTRLAGLSGDGGGARGSNETAVEKDAIREAAAAVTAMSSTSKSPGGWCEKRKSAASMTDGLLGWALRSVGGTGEEGKPRGNLDGRKGVGNHRERIEECGPDVRFWSPSPVGGKRRGDEHPGDVVPGGEGEGSLTNGYGSGSGDSDSGNPGGCLSGGGSGDDDSGSGYRWRSTPSPPSPGERASRGVGMARGRDEGSSENFGDVDGDGGGDWIEGGVKSEDETNDGDKRKEPGFWEKDGNTRFLQGVTKHGDAWARLARRHAEIGVVEVNVDASDQDSIDGSDYGDYGDYGDYDEAGYSCGESGEDGTWGLTDAPRARACSATMGNSVDGVEGDEYRDRRHRRRRAVTCPAERERGRREREQEQQRQQGGRREDAPTSAREPKIKKRRKRPSRVKERKRRRDRLWDEEEHARFVEGFNRHGNAWGDVAQVVGTRDQGEVERHAARWVDRSGKQLRDKADAIRTGGWDAEEQARFLEGLGRHGRSWPDIARVVRTRTSRQARAHAQYLFEKEDRVTNRVLQRLASSVARTAANLAPGQTAPDTAASAPAHGASAPKGLRAGTVCASPNRAPRRKAAAEASARLQSTAAADPEDVGSDGDGSGDDDGGNDDDDDPDDSDGSGVDDADEDEDADTDHESTLSLSSSSCAAPEAVGGGAAGSVGGEGKGRRRGRGGQRRPRSLAGEDTRHWGAGERGGSSEGERGYAAGNGTTAGSEQKSQRKKKEGRNRYRYWGQDEHERFLEAHAKFGNSWFDVARAVGTRTRLQVYNHAQRVLKRHKSSGEVGSEKEA